MAENQEHIQIIEINGIKMEIDLRQAKRVDRFRVGDKVKLLKKNYSDHSVYPGVIAGFENFKELPTIIVAYFKSSYNEAELKFEYINAESKDVDIVATDDNYIPLEKGHALELFDRAIIKKEQELEDLRRKREYFLNNFSQYFSLKGE